MCRQHGIDFLFNNTYGDIYGPWLPGTGRAEYSDAQLDHAAATRRFRGIILDEVEHRQIHHIDCGPGPYLADVRGQALEQCYERLLESVRTIASRYRQHGGVTVGEQVFPVLSHVLARAGVIPAPKFLSFSYWPVYFAVAAGAALQYGTELWIVHDFWGAEPFWGEIAPFAPGFSPEAYRSSLLTAYWLGADAAYTEALHNLVLLGKLTDEERRVMQQHKVPHRPIDQNEWLFERRYSLNAYGKIHRWFARHYVPTHARRYTFRDIQPRVAIVRFPDSLWAQPEKPRALPFHGLYGPGGPPAESRHRAWLDAWHVLTHDVVPPTGVSIYGTQEIESFVAEIAQRNREVDAAAGWPVDYPYVERYPLCPVDGVLVFDHLASRRVLDGAQLIILTGELISDETATAVVECVKGGAHCLSLAHLVPAPLQQAGASAPYEIAVGAGRVLVTDDFRADRARQFIRPHLGPPDRVRYRFGSQTVTIRQAEGYAGALVNEADLR
jgi:hypothetical protein